MSRRSRRRRTIVERSAVISRPLTHTLLRSPSPVLHDLRPVEDRRLYHPLQFFRPARQLSGHPVEPLKVKATPRNRARPFIAHGLRFSAPQRTVLCVRRETRKEVLFAKRKTGKGARSKRRARNWYSSISCKR